MTNMNHYASEASLVRKDVRSYFGSLPMDVFPLVAKALSLKKFKYLFMNGYTPRYGSAEISSIHFEEEYNREDLI